MFFFIPGPQFHDSVIMTELPRKLHVNYVLQIKDACRWPYIQASRSLKLVIYVVK